MVVTPPFYDRFSALDGAPPLLTATTATPPAPPQINRHIPTGPGVWLVGVDSAVLGNEGAGQILWSEDGFDWTPVQTILFGGIKGISYANGMFVAGGAIVVSGNKFAAGIISSLDGKTWKTEVTFSTLLNSSANYAQSFFDNIFNMPLFNVPLPLKFFEVVNTNPPVPPSFDWPIVHPGQPVDGIDPHGVTVSVQIGANTTVLQAEKFQGFQTVAALIDTNNFFIALLFGELEQVAQLLPGAG